MVLLQQVDNLAVKPCGVAEFEGVAMAARQRFQKSLQPIHVDVPTRRQLKQDSSDFLFQGLRVREEFLARRFGILQLFHVGDVPAGFHGKGEAGWRLVTPRVEGLLTGKAIEGVVDLDGLKMPDVKIKHLVVPHVFRIKWPPPVRIMPAGRSDVHPRRHRPLTSTTDAKRNRVPLFYCTVKSPRGRRDILIRVGGGRGVVYVSLETVFARRSNSRTIAKVSRLQYSSKALRSSVFSCPLTWPRINCSQASPASWPSATRILSYVRSGISAGRTRLSENEPLKRGW